MNRIIEQVKQCFDIEDCTFIPVCGHEGGRNSIMIVSRNGDKQYILRVSDLRDRTEKDYLAETEYIHYLAEKGAPVADVIRKSVLRDIGHRRIQRILCLI